MSMNKLEISIIVPVYNVEKYLDHCVDSILAQSFRGFELILVDDGSPDNCGIICDEYVQKDPRVRVIHQKNQGVSAARNNGVAASFGEYVTFVDSDDWVDSRFLARMYEQIEEYEADMCVMHIQKVAHDEENRNAFGGEARILTSREAIECYCRDYNEKILGPMAKLMRREIALNNPFPEDRSYAEDLATTYRWYHNSDRIVDLSDRLYYYRVREGSAVRSRYSINKLANLRTLEEIMEFFEEHDYQELYKIFVHRYLFDLARQYRDVDQYVKDTYILKQLKTKMSNVIKKEKIRCSINLDNNPDCYNILYPRCMYVYWTVKGVVTGLRKLK